MNNGNENKHLTVDADRSPSTVGAAGVWLLMDCGISLSCRLTVDFSVLEFLPRIFLQWPQETGAVVPLGVMLD